MFKKYLCIFFAILLSCNLVLAQRSKTKLPVKRWLSTAAAQYQSLIAQCPDSASYPRSVDGNGKTIFVKSKDWTSGFFAGNLWHLYLLTGNKKWIAPAKKWTESLDKEKYNGGTHDLGFMMYCSYGTGDLAQPSEAYKQVIIQSAKTLVTRYSDKVKAIKSWDFGKDKWQYPVIVDNLMNLELLLEATKLTGDSSFYHVAINHADTDLKYRFRPDNSTYHVLDFETETGKLRNRRTYQGYADSSCWSRGQAWAIHAFANMYEKTKLRRYLEASVKAADYFIAKTTEGDGIPAWDFNDPSVKVPKDASAAAVAASGLIMLSKYVPNKKSVYLKKAESMLKTLGSPAYLAKVGTNNFFLLKHSTGNWPAKSEIDQPLIYADYYFLEALYRHKNL